MFIYVNPLLFVNSYPPILTTKPTLLLSSHSQMNPRVFEAFDQRQMAVVEYMSNPSNARHAEMANSGQPRNSFMSEGVDAQAIAVGLAVSAEALQGLAPDPLEDDPIHVEQKMEFFGMEPPSAFPQNTMPMNHLHQAAPPVISETQQVHHDANAAGQHPAFNSRRSLRNPSIISYGGLRSMSINSETTFGRAMSGLSALSIDWENLEDFDLEVDHSAHITNQSPPGNRRTSFRRSFAAPNAGNGEQDNQVTFKA